MTTPEPRGSSPGYSHPMTSFPADVDYRPLAPGDEQQQQRRGSPATNDQQQHRGGGVRYPPLRFLSREQDHHDTTDTSSPTGVPSSPLGTPAVSSQAPNGRRSASTDDGSSDVSYSSADTAIFVGPDGKQTRMGPRDMRIQSTDSHGMADFAPAPQFATPEESSTHGYNGYNRDFKEPRSEGASLTNGYAVDSGNTHFPLGGHQDTTLQHFYQEPSHELCRQGEDSGVHNDHILSGGHDYRDTLGNSPDTLPRCSDDRPFRQTSARFEDSQECGPITSHTDHGPAMIDSRDKSLINNAPSTLTAEPWQSSSAAIVSYGTGNYNTEALANGSYMYSGGENTSPTQRRAHPEPTVRHHGLTGTQPRRTLPADDDDSDFMRGEFNDYTDSRPLGDLTSGNDCNVYTGPVSGKVDSDDISCEGTDLTGPLNGDPNLEGQRSVSYSSSRGEVGYGVGSDKDRSCHPIQSENTAGTLIHPGENLSGGVPDHAVNSQVNMNGMYTKAIDTEDSGVYGQLRLDKAYNSLRNSSPNHEMTMDNPLTYPVITNIQNENNSDTSSVDSDGVPYRKSALKTRQKKDGAKRTGRKVRFAEPIILNEPKTTGLSARERLGLVDKFTGGNRYVYVPSVGLKQMQDDDNKEQPITENTQKDIAKKSVTFSPDTKLHDAGSSVPSPTVNGPVIPRTGSNRTDENDLPNQLGLSTLSIQNIKNSQKVQYVDSENGAKQDTLIVHHHNQDNDRQAMQQNVPSPVPNGLDHNMPENKPLKAKIIRRPGIHVSRGKSGMDQSITDTNNPVSPLLPQTQGNTQQRLSKHRASSQSSLRTIHEVPRQSPTIPEDNTPSPASRHEPPGQANPIMRNKVVRGTAQPATDLRVGRYFPDSSRRSSSSSSGEEGDRSPGFVQPNPTGTILPNSHQPHRHVRVGQQALPTVDPRTAFSTSSSDNFRPDTRRTTDPRMHLDNQAYASYNGAIDHVSTTPKNNHERVPRLSTPSTEELAVMTPQGDTSSVPSPVSGDSGISSSSSLTDINKEPYVDNLADNYNTLNYIRKGKTQNVINRVDNLRQSQTRINTGPPGNQALHGEARQPTSVVRRDSSNSDLRRGIVSDSSSTGGAIDQWTRATEYSPRDDSSVGYDSRTTSMTSTTSDVGHHGARTSWSQAQSPEPRSGTLGHHGDQRGYTPNPGSPAQMHHNHYQDDPDPYGKFLRSATNRCSSKKTKLVPIPLDILNPMSPGPGGHRNPDVTPQPSRRDQAPGQPYAHDDQSSLYSTSSVYGNHQDYSRLPSQPRYLQDQSPQYSSTADIYNLLKQKTRNPFR